MLANAPLPESTPKDENSERKVLIAANWFLVPLPAAAAIFANDFSTWWIFAALSIFLGCLIRFNKMFSSVLSDYIVSFCFVGHSILLTSALTGHHLQIDSHMLFFAVLAIVSTLSNPRALFFATGLVAVHHLSLTFFMAKLVFPDGSLEENVYRTAMHAAIVLLESGVLLLSMFKRAAVEDALEAERTALEEQSEIAQQARIRAKKNAEDAKMVVHTLDQHLDELSQGKMDCQIQTEFPEEYVRLRNSFNATVEKLDQTLGQVSRVSANIRRNVDGMRQSSEELSNRSENQAATLEESAAAIEEMTASVNQSTMGTRDAKATAVSARQDAEKIRGMVNEAVTAMEEIKDSSAKMSNIIGVIDDIAFQTNLLALNAGVEAARAGEEGRGFAVVAVEVRNLAQRSADSATEIKELIEQSSQQVLKGVESVVKAGDATSDFVARINEISAAIASIASGSEEQSLGLVEINSGINVLDTVTQRNAAMANALMSSGHSLCDHAEELAQLMHQFRSAEALITPHHVAAE
jgi:methyl-accepting chemotaxis protein